MLKEFRDFIARGNVLDLAVGIVIGAAFTAIVNSFVKDILSPIIGIFGTANFNDQFVVLKDPKHTGPYASLDAASKAGAVTFNYGSFITNVINFLIVAFALFLIVKAANKMKDRLARKEAEDAAEAAATPAAPTREEELLTEIRDLLKK